jgi:replicative DNA helicase
VFKRLDAATVHIRQAQLTLVAAAPGIGKSVFALTEAVETRVPTLYFSADSDAFVCYTRVAAMVTGWTVTDIETQIENGHTATIDAKLNGLEHLRLNFDPSPSIDDIEDDTRAFALTYGEWPRLIVVDNLSNVYNDTGGEGYQSLEATCDFLHQLARETGAAIIALHHVTGQHEDGTTPPPMSGLRGKVSKIPAMILNLFKPAEGQLGVAVVKNRTGRADPSGGMVIYLNAELDRMKLEG